jgi:hypothetical protein
LRDAILDDLGTVRALPDMAVHFLDESVECPISLETV